MNCPLLKSNPVECEKNHCAWYMTREGCAALVFVETMQRIAKALETIAEDVEEKAFRAGRRN